MTPEQAKTAGDLNQKIQELTAHLAKINAASDEAVWITRRIMIEAPLTGSATPAGNTINVVYGEAADDETTALILQTAKAKYEALLAAMQAQLVNM